MTETLKPCRSPYCECTVGECSHPGCYDARGEEFPLKWKWHQAPVKTQWGDEMVVASLAIDNDHTVSIYCERDQTAAVERMLTKSTAQSSPTAQEPVAIEELTDIFHKAWQKDFKESVLGGMSTGSEELKGQWREHVKAGIIALLAAQSPPTAQLAVPLTNDEVDRAIDQIDQNAINWTQEFFKFARAIEAAHGITKGQL
jgi:hypothetical protein